MINIEQYSPGSHKLIKHLDHLVKIRDGISVSPIHLSLWPVAICNLNCSYCCGRNILDRNNKLTLEEYKTAIDILHKYGLISLEFSGSPGESLLWEYFKEAVDYAYDKGLKLSLITNGLLLKTIPSETLSKFAWIRVSLQSIAHAKQINFKEIAKHTRISASYIVANSENINELYNLQEFANINKLIIRIATVRPCDCHWIDAVREKVKLINRTASNINEDQYLFFSEKESGTPLGCYSFWIRAALDWNGYLLPCPSIQLNVENVGMIPDKYRICHISNLEEWILNNKPHDLGYRCKFCNCGKEQNDLVYQILNKIEDYEFV